MCEGHSFLEITVQCSSYYIDDIYDGNVNGAILNISRAVVDPVRVLGK